MSNQEMRTFETGARRSIEEGKGRYDLLPWDAIMTLIELDNDEI